MLFYQYLKLGFFHVVPNGLDHILFILAIFFLDPKPKSLLIHCSLFTLAHSVTLGVVSVGAIRPPEWLIEPMIALSIVITAIGNILNQKVSWFRLLFIFLFGLVHGMGFANAISSEGFSVSYFYSSLISFNLGIEISQLFIMLISYIVFHKWFRNESQYKKMIAIPGSTIIAGIALYWTIDRIVG